MGQVAITDGKILIDNQPQQIISGSLHYFRIHPDLWDDRLDKAAAIGVNTIETYVPWNIHEPHPGEYNFSGICDLEKFIDKIHARGLKMILRPGPYICAEWDNGGFPGWLLALPGVELRRMNAPYIDALTRYFKVLLPKIQQKLYTTNGPIIMVQVENEYGSYCHDKNYLHYIYNLYREQGLDVPLFTSDGGSNHYILGGTIPEAVMTLNFGSGAEQNFAAGRQFRPQGPDFCMEFWNGWFDHWGEKHHTRPASNAANSAAGELDRMLKMGANVNFYMLHGGTNFGFTNGANGNYWSNYAATVTSYDYDCPLNECGDPNAKFYACRDVIGKYIKLPKLEPIPPSKKVVPPATKLTASAPLLAQAPNLSVKSGHALTPPTLEQLGENFGFVHYHKHLAGPLPEIDLRLFEVNDFAQVWLNGQYLGSRFRDNGENQFMLPPIPAEGAELDILVENCGRINYGPYVGKDFKGIKGGVTICLQMQLDWDYDTLPLEKLDALQFGDFADSAATFHRGEFELDETGDAFLLRPGRKGLVWVNGFNLGRYWDKGPTESLYIPCPVLKKGRNEVVVLELEKLDSDTLHFATGLRLGPTE